MHAQKNDEAKPLESGVGFQLLHTNGVLDSDVPETWMVRSFIGTSILFLRQFRRLQQFEGEFFNITLYNAPWQGSDIHFAPCR